MNVKIIVPVKFLNLINGYLTEDSKVNFTVSENHVMMETDSTMILSRIIDERFRIMKVLYRMITTNY
jgi:DNA polymerase III sliding clamp (beta) subunit (PCNA family)